MTTPKKGSKPKPTAIIEIKEPTRDEIGLRAYFIWEREGKPPGREQQHWLLAVAELRAEQKKVLALLTKPAVAPKPKIKPPAKPKTAKK